MKKRKKSTVWLKILLLVLLVILGVVFYLFMKEYLRLKQCNDTYDRIRSTAWQDASQTDDTPSDGEQQGEKSTYKSPIDFHAIGKRVRAWIVIPDTVIDYPVMQADNNEYYLYHLADGTYNALGAIFLDYRNKADFSDRNSVMYGHWMMNGSMFAAIHKYKDQAFYKKHHFYTVYTPQKELKIEVFAVCIVPGVMDEFPVTFKDDKEFTDFVNKRKENSVISSNVSVGTNDQVVTITTCASEINNGRIAVYGVIRN